MVDHQDLFNKYGLQLPRHFHIPTKEEIDYDVKQLSLYRGLSQHINYRHVSAFFLSCTSKDSGIKISDHNKFIESFNLDIDFSKIHPELVASFNLLVSISPTSTPFYIKSYDYSEQNLSKYLTHFSPEYRLQKLFSPDADERFFVLLEEHIESTLNKVLLDSDASHFLKELYKYILQEQKNQFKYLT